MSLKLKAVQGFSWTVFEGILGQSVIFLVGIILARILSPSDFGLVGIITAFISISTAIVDGGLSNALVRKNTADNLDYNTVFYSNLIIGILLYMLLFVFSSSIALFFNEPELEKLLKVSGIILVLESLIIIQKVLMVKELDFKTQAIISVISSVIGGLIATFMAFSGFGVWSLVALSIIRPLVRAVLYWWKSKWTPLWLFSFERFKELFDYSYKLLLATLLNSLYKNIYYVLIGKFFSTTSLGYYTRADQFQAPFSNNITIGIKRISFPILSTIQDDKIRLRNGFVKFLRFSVLINFTIMLAIAAMAKPIVLLLIGEKWYQSIFYLQLLCIPGMLYPLQILNLNLLAIKGHSNLFLKLEIIKKIILLPLVYVSMLFSIEIMLYSLILFSIIEYFINSSYTKRILNLSIFQQLREISVFMLIAGLTFLSMFSITFFASISTIMLLAVQILVGLIVTVLLHEIFKLKEYRDIKNKIKLIINKLL